LSVDTSKPDARGPDAIARTTHAMFALFAAGLLLVVVRVGQLQLAPEDELRPFVDSRTSRQAEPGLRGDIVDRRGRVLAASRVRYQAILDPEATRGMMDEAVVRLSEAIGDRLGESPDEIGERLVRALARNDAVRAGEIEGGTVRRYMPVGGLLDRADAVAVRRARVPGLSLERRQERLTPGGDVAAALVGKVGFGHAGLVGAELTFDERLTGGEGGLRFVRDARGRALWMERGSTATPDRGDDLRLSIDLELQRLAHAVLTEGVEEADAAAGRLVAVDPATGEVLAIVDVYREVPGLVEYPWIDPENPDAPRPDVGDGPRPRYRVLPEDPARSGEAALARLRCVTDVYEPGSVFKSMVWASALEMGLLPGDEIVRTSNGYALHGRVLRDVTRQRELTWDDVLAKSSNIGMAIISERMPHTALRGSVRRFGFGSFTGVGLAGESGGIVPEVKNWSKLTPSSIAMGHEVAVTAVQAARMMCVFARTGAQAGTLPELRLTAVGPGEHRDLVSDRVLSPASAVRTREVLVRVAENVDRKMKRRDATTPEPRYGLWGKSGTAEIPKTPPKGLKRPKGDGYFEDQYVSSFAGGAPVADPRIVVLVTIDDPGPDRVRRKEHYGSDVAGPVVRRFVEGALVYLGVSPEADSGELVASAD
jgi:cell division protein FtsI (penicillin-binding protein 3)